MSQAFKDALAKGVVRPAVLFEAELPGGVVNFWTGIYPLTFQKRVWQATGQFGGIDRVGETSELKAEGVVVTLTNIRLDGALLQRLLDEVRQGQPVNLWFALLDEDYKMISDIHNGTSVVPLRSGRIDHHEIATDAQSISIRIFVENALYYAVQTNFERRFTDAHQQFRYPGDKGFEYVPGLDKKTLKWGGGSTSQQRGSGARDIPRRVV